MAHYYTQHPICNMAMHQNYARRSASLKITQQLGKLADGNRFYGVSCIHHPISFVTIEWEILRAFICINYGNVVLELGK